MDYQTPPLEITRWTSLADFDEYEAKAAGWPESLINDAVREIWRRELESECAEADAAALLGKETQMDYDREILDLFNEHARAHSRACAKPLATAEEGFHAFVLNAISAAVDRSERPSLKALFSKEAWGEKTIILEELQNTFGCSWFDEDDQEHFGFKDAPVSDRAKLWLDVASGHAIGHLLDNGSATVIGEKAGSYGGACRRVVVNVDELNHWTAVFWERKNELAREALKHAGRCHYCGLPATDFDGLGVPVCDNCR